MGGKHPFDVVFEFNSGYHRIVKTNNGYRIEEYYEPFKGAAVWVRMTSINSEFAKLVLQAIRGGGD